MRFVHAGDFHIGATPESGRQWGKERAISVAGALGRIVDLCNSEKADLLLIPGDLFNAPPLTKELKEAAYSFSRLENTRVVIIAGNHDYLSEDCAYGSFDLGENVFLLSSESFSSVYFEDINTEVHGLSYHKKEIREPLYDELTAPADDRIHVLLAHGGDSLHVPIKYSQLAKSGFDYIALGHIHQPKLFKGTHMAYCGSPEPLDRTDIGARGCFVGEVTKSTFTIMWRPLSKTQYRLLEINSDITLTQAALEECVKEELAAHPSDLIVVLLEGSRDPAYTVDTEAVLQLGRVVEVIDSTNPEYDLEQLLADHDGDIISYYINMLDTPDKTPEMKKALYFGLSALLGD